MYLMFLKICWPPHNVFSFSVHACNTQAPDEKGPHLMPFSCLSDFCLFLSTQAIYRCLNVHINEKLFVQFLNLKIICFQKKLFEFWILMCYRSCYWIKANEESDHIKMLTVTLTVIFMLFLKKWHVIAMFFYNGELL